MPGRVFLVNVGANAAHPYASPLFDDGTFELLPILDPDARGPHLVYFRDLRSYYHPHQDLLQYVPQRLRDTPVHHDPEFETFTYGDNCDTSPRAAGLRRVEPGDYLLFLARLVHHRTKEAGFYLVGYLEMERIFASLKGRLPDKVVARIGRNAHVRRAEGMSKGCDGFWVFAGSRRSRRLERAVPLDRTLASLLLRDSQGNPWEWPEHRSDLQVIGSYTRSCRCVLDPDRQGHGDRLEALWRTVAAYDGSPTPAAPLAPLPSGP